PDGSAMQFDELLHDRETEAESPVAASHRGVGLSKPLENVRQELRRNPFAGVAYRDFQVGIHTFEKHLNPASLRCELDRVREKIPNDLLQSSRIPHHGAGM